LNYPYRRKGKNTRPIPLNKITPEDKKFLLSFNFYEKKLLLNNLDNSEISEKKLPQENLKWVNQSKTIKNRKFLKLKKSSDKKFQKKAKFCLNSYVKHEIKREYSPIVTNQTNEKIKNLNYSIQVFFVLSELLISNLILISVLESPFNDNTILLLEKFLEIDSINKFIGNVNI
jgi:hypothetical protein